MKARISDDYVAPVKVKQKDPKAGGPQTTTPLAESKRSGNSLDTDSSPLPTHINWDIPGVAGTTETHHIANVPRGLTCCAIPNGCNVIVVLMTIWI